MYRKCMEKLRLHNKFLKTQSLLILSILSYLTNKISVILFVDNVLIVSKDASKHRTIRNELNASIQDYNSHHYI